jgi:uncharacterized membrane protein
MASSSPGRRPPAAPTNPPVGQRALTARLVYGAILLAVTAPAVLLVASLTNTPPYPYCGGANYCDWSGLARAAATGVAAFAVCATIASLACSKLPRGWWIVTAVATVLSAATVILALL